MKVLEDVPGIYLDVDPSDFSHLWVLTPLSVLELYLAGAQSGDAAEIDLERAPLMLNCRPVALLTPAVMYGFALFQSRVATKTAAALTMMPKTEPAQIKTRRFRLVMVNLLISA